MNDSNDEIMTTNEVADYLRLSTATIYRLAREKTIPGLRIGRVWRFRRDLIDQWMADQWQGKNREAQ